MNLLIKPDMCAILGSYDHWIVSVSGGPDSMCLLVQLDAIADEYDATIHVRTGNHGLREDAADDIALVEQWCQDAGADCTVGYYSGTFSETAMRARRKQSLATLARRYPSSCVMTGHHLDDRIETSLYRLWRGAGVLGFVGSSSVREGVFWPLSDVNKQTIVDYCEQYAIPYRVDTTNTQSLGGPRNWIRHVLIPLMRDEYGESVWYGFWRSLYGLGDAWLQRLKGACCITRLPPSPVWSEGIDCRGVSLVDGVDWTPSLITLSLLQLDILRYQSESGLDALVDFFRGKSGNRMDYGDCSLRFFGRQVVVTPQGDFWRTQMCLDRVGDYRLARQGDVLGSQSLTRWLQKQGVPLIRRSSSYVLEQDGVIVDCILPGEYVEWTMFLHRRSFSSLANYHGLDMATRSLPCCACGDDHHPPTDEEAS